MTIYSKFASGSSSEIARLSPMVGQTAEGEAVLEFTTSEQNIQIAASHDELLKLLTAVSQALIRTAA
jgi:hypothetical protein